MQTYAVFENIADRLQQEIRKAQNSIFIAVAWFTNKNLFIELLNQAIKGCRVTLIISNDIINQSASIDYNQLNIGKSRVYKVGDGETILMHNKFCVIDFSLVITGSYNWSYKAESNFENIIITQDDTFLAQQFIEEFNNILKQYFPEDLKRETQFPINKIVQRLEILKNYIALEDISEVKKEVLKLSLYDFNEEIREIILEIEKEEFTSAIIKIQSFLTKNLQLMVRADPEIAALKLEIKNLENQLNAFDNEKNELEKVMIEFHHRHTVELGDIILEILKFRKIKFKGNKEKFFEAEKDEKQFREEFNSEKKKEIFELTDDERVEMKKKFRKATFLCHPDKVSKEFREQAHKIFIELKEAYDTNNLKRVSEILNYLETGIHFNSESESISEKDQLKAAIAKLRLKMEILMTEIINIKQSESYKIVSSIDDWDDYFNKTKEKLQIELKEIKGL